MQVSERIKEVFENKGVSYKFFCKVSGVNYRTLRNYIDGRMPAADFMIAFHETLGVNLNWLLTGMGEMYTAEFKGIAAPNTDYQPIPQIPIDKVAEDSAEFEYPQSAREQRLTVFIKHWMKTHSDDERAWFEIDFKNHYKEYGDWLDKNN